MQQIDFPGQAQVGLEVVFTVNIGMGTAEMHAKVTTSHGIVFEPDAFEIDFAAGRDILVERIRCGVCLRFVEVVPRLAIDDPLLPDVETGTDEGGEILTDELVLFKRGAVLEIDVHFQDAILDLVAQGDVVDERARLVLDHVDRIGGLEHVEVAVPHQVIGVDALHGRGDEGRVGHLHQEVVFLRFVEEIQ